MAEENAAEYAQWRGDFLDIGPGRLSIPWPRDLPWQIQEQGSLFVGEVDARGSAVIGIALRADDASESVAKGDVAAYLREIAAPDQIDGRIEGLESRTTNFRSSTGSGQNLELWQRAQLLGSWLRIALFRLQGDVDTPGARELALDIVTRAQFGSALTEAERDMPMAITRRAIVSERIEVRVPATWRMEELDDGRIVFEHPVRDEGNLYIELRDYDPALDTGPDPDSKHWVIVNNAEADMQTGEMIHMFLWHRMIPVLVGERAVKLMGAFFNWVILESKFDDDEIKNRYHLLDQCIRNYRPLR